MATNNDYKGALTGMQIDALPASIQSLSDSLDAALKEIEQLKTQLAGKADSSSLTTMEAGLKSYADAAVDAAKTSLTGTIEENEHTVASAVNDLDTRLHAVESGE